MSEPVPSPCVGICALNGDSICLGCGRHIDEIAAWSRLGEQDRRAVFERAALRRARLAHSTESKEPPR